MTKYKNKPKQKEIVIKGIPAAPGIALGKAYPIYDEEIVVPKRKITEKEIETEINRFKRALTKTKTEILDIHQRIAKEMGTEKARIFGAHLMIQL